MCIRDRTYILHNTNDDVVRSPEIIAQSSVAIGTICTVDGKEIKTADGKAIKASYAGEGYNKHGGWAGYAVLAVDNVSKKTEGYTFNKAEANFDRICQEYAAAAELTTAEAKALKEFVTGMTSLNSYDLSDKEIKEIRDNYKDSSFEKEAIKIKANYEEGVALSRDKFIRDQLPHLVEVTPPSVLSFQNEARKQMTAQKSKAAKQKVKTAHQRHQHRHAQKAAQTAAAVRQQQVHRRAQQRQRHRHRVSAQASEQQYLSLIHI